MAVRNLENTIYELIEHMNSVLVENNIIGKYTVRITERERFIPFVGKDDKVIKKKQYYGLLQFLLQGTDNVLLWRQEYIFHNLTDKNRDFLWKEKLCKVFLYEALGTFAAVTHGQYERDLAEGNGKAGTFDIENDTFVPLEAPSISQIDHNDSITVSKNNVTA